MERPTDSYGLVLFLVILTYIVISINRPSAWWEVAIVALQGLMLFFALRTSRAQRMWVLLSGVYTLIVTAAAILNAALPGGRPYGQMLGVIGGILLFVTPIAIVLRISKHTVVTTQTVLGAICVYVLLGFAFAALYRGIALLTHMPFFTGAPPVTWNDYLFFSYTTLTTVGYGNLVPAGNVGQTFAMLEALLGQTYLVIGVARLVSLWTQTPRTPSLPPPGAP
jgi:hypothetical protein